MRRTVNCRRNGGAGSGLDVGPNRCGVARALSPPSAVRDSLDRLTTEVSRGTVTPAAAARQLLAAARENV